MNDFPARLSLILFSCSSLSELPSVSVTVAVCLLRFAVLFSAANAWLYAHLLTSSTVYDHMSDVRQTSCRTGRAVIIIAALWIYIPYPIQWGIPTFNAGEAFAMMAALFVSLFESTRTFYAAARYGSITPVPPSVIACGAGWMVVVIKWF